MTERERKLYAALNSAYKDWWADAKQRYRSPISFEEWCCDIHFLTDVDKLMGDEDGGRNGYIPDNGEPIKLFSPDAAKIRKQEMLADQAYLRIRDKLQHAFDYRYLKQSDNVNNLENIYREINDLRLDIDKFKDKDHGEPVAKPEVNLPKEKVFCKDCIWFERSLMACWNNMPPGEFHIEDVIALNPATGVEELEHPNANLDCMGYEKRRSEEDS